MRRLLMTLGFIAVGVLLAVPASATPAPEAGCGADFDLLTVADTINNVDRRIFDDAEWAALQLVMASADLNGDGWLCSKHYKPNQGRDKHLIGPEDVGVTDYVICLFMDNNARGRD